MPAIFVGPIKITNVSSGGNVNFGDTGFLAPKLSTKSYSGAAGGATGDYTTSISGTSSTNTMDNDVVDNSTRGGT